ncbi:hypothetical protein QUA56_33005 [Microcoleus sp. N3A4]
MRENSIQRVVNISRFGAGAEPNLGTVSFSGTVESIFNQTAAKLLHLRPGYFMENFLQDRIEFIRHAIASSLFPLLVTAICPGLAQMISAMKLQSFYLMRRGQVNGLVISWELKI